MRRLNVGEAQFKERVAFILLSFDMKHIRHVLVEPDGCFEFGFV